MDAINLDKDLQEARDILTGDTMMLVELRHLRALQNHFDDTMIRIALKLAQTHDWVMEL